MTIALLGLPFPNYEISPAWLLILFLLIGFAALNFGGDYLTDGAVTIATNLNISKAVVGLTIVSMATSMPEMITSLLAAKTSPGLALGNILGSNIANIGLILGITALIIPLTVQQRLIRREVPLMIGVTLLFTLFAIGGFERWEGFVMLAILPVYLYFVIRWAKRDPEEAQETSEETEACSTKKGLGFVVAGSALLAIGADVLVGTSVELAGRLGVSDVLIGLTIVAIGTSLPELAASVSAARSGHGDICVGNVIGSNLFNILLIGGAVASLIPIPVDPILFRMEFPALLFITLLFLVLYKNGRRVTAKEGLFLLFSYFSIIALSSIF